MQNKEEEKSNEKVLGVFKGLIGGVAVGMGLAHLASKTY